MRRALPVLLVLAGLTAAGLSGCSEATLVIHGVKEVTSSPVKPDGTYKVGQPYQANGVWYYPQEDYDYEETGIASWYGPDYHGKLTANGELFDQNGVSAAHRTLPMPSLVRVTNLENGRTLVVRVNDRGPFKPGRVIDLSKRAAQLLDFETKGQAKVKVQILAQESRELASRAKARHPGAEDAPAPAVVPRPQIAGEALTPPSGVRQAPPTRNVSARSLPTASASPRQIPADAQERKLDQQEVVVVPVKAAPRIYIQAGAFSRFDYANRRSAQVSPVAKASISQIQQKDRALYRVRVGPLNTVEEADTVLAQLIASGIQDARLVVE